MEETKHHVFVYGTLKTGQPNSTHVMNNTDLGKATLLGRARSVDNYPMIIANRFNTPYVLYEKGKGKVRVSFKYHKQSLIHCIYTICHPSYSDIGTNTL